VILRKSSAVLGVSAIAALILATGAEFAPPSIPTGFNPTIVQAMDAVAGHTSLALNAPTFLPPRRSGYLTAMTAALPDAYQVTVWDTREPLHVNNAAIISERMSGGNVARFGALRLSQPMPPQGAPNYLTALEQHNPLWAGGPARLEPGTVNLGDGIQAVHYQRGLESQLDWMEGAWTVEVAGRSLANAEKAALPIVHLLNAYYLPPYPGIYAVRLQDGGHTAITSIDWMRGKVLSYVTNDHASATNPVVTGSMAVSWRRFTSPPIAPRPLTRISYTRDAAATILHDGQLAGFPHPPMVPTMGVHSRWLTTKVYATTPGYRPTIRSYKVLTLTYSNFEVQEAKSRHAFGSGGDQVQSGTVSLVIPAASLSRPVTGTWTTVYGIQGSGTHSFLTFDVDGVYFVIGSNAGLSVSQMDRIAESLKPSAVS